MPTQVEVRSRVYAMHKAAIMIQKHWKRIYYRRHYVYAIKEIQREQEVAEKYRLVEQEIETKVAGEKGSAK